MDCTWGRGGAGLEVVLDPRAGRRWGRDLPGLGRAGAEGGGPPYREGGLGYQVGGLVRTGLPRAFLETGLFVGWSLAEQNSTCGPH